MPLLRRQVQQLVVLVSLTLVWGNSCRQRLSNSSIVARLKMRLSHTHAFCSLSAVLVGPSMLLFAFLPHGGHDEEDSIVTLEAVRRIMKDGNKTGSTYFFIRGLVRYVRTRCSG